MGPSELMKRLETLQDLIENFRQRGDRHAIIAFGKDDVVEWSFSRLADEAIKLANGLSAQGVRQDEPIALLANNAPEWLVACFAIIQAGGVVVPLDVQFSDEPLAHALKDSACRLVFTDVRYLERLEKVGLKDKLKPILLDGDGQDNRHWQHLNAEAPAELPRVEPKSRFALFYTSGTTGPPKGVPLTHANVTAQLNTILELDLMDENDRLLLPLPLHHVYPYVIGMLAPLLIGGPIVLPKSLTGPQMLRAIREGRVTIILGVPRLYRALYSGIEARAQVAGRMANSLFKTSLGLSTWIRRRLGIRAGKILLRPLHTQTGPQLRIVASGGAALDPEIGWKLESIGWQLAIGYGLTETSPLLTLNPPGKAKIGSVGKPIPGVEIRIDTSVTPEEARNKQEQQGKNTTEGEVQARGPNVFSEYHNLPDKTKEAFTEDGWFRTGDLGYLDEEQHLFITGRVSTLIVAEGGEKIQPDNVEEIYAGSPGIREIGILQREKKLVAVVVPEMKETRREVDGDAAKAVREAIEGKSRELPSYQRIVDVVITQEPLPRTRLGKISRHLLEERFEAAKRDGKAPEKEKAGPIRPEEMSPDDRVLLEESAARETWELLAKRYPDQPLTPDANPQLDLGLDSLEWLNLTLEIRQRTGVELSEEAIGRVETVRDLLEEVSEAGKGARPPADPLREPEKVLSDEQKRRLESVGPFGSAIAWLLDKFNRLIVRGLLHLEIRGARLPERGPFVIVANHVSFLDPFVLGAAIDFKLLQHIYWGGWRTIAFGNPITRAFSRIARVMPIDPKGGIFSTMAFAAAVLKRGENLAWFPEGQRSPNGELQVFKPGIAMYLAHFRVTVVPAFIQGTYEALPPGRVLPRIRKVVVTFGEPVNAAELEKEGKGDEARDRIIDALQGRVAQLGGNAAKQK
jgi:long-chain acyl-CoA synthetase